MMKSAAKARYHHGALEQALVDEAVRQVRERGTDQVSLRGLAQIIGVSPSAAYQHFPDKAALLHAVCLAGGHELGRRMQAAVDAVPEDSDGGAIDRFQAVGRAYVEFAVGEPHLFRHVFGPLGVEGGTAEHEIPGLDDDAEPDGPYAILLERLAELGARGLLRPGLQPGSGIDVFAWSLVHGFSSLVVDGFLPLEAGEGLLMMFGRLILTDPAFETFAAAVAARPALQVVPGGAAPARTPEAPGGR
ncbi:MAG TPA: TetR/AcrR family transcriptional regulator [Kineosporiaceae bacterium]|nr:TetR/AcrR family transcriptional regulator [Kineosporiaceae bacterium]